MSRCVADVQVTGPGTGKLCAMPCPCSDLVLATDEGLPSVVGFTGARDWLGLLCSGVDPNSTVSQGRQRKGSKAVAGSWSGWCQVALRDVKVPEFNLCLFPSYLEGHLGLVTLSSGYVSPKESF